MTYTIAECTVN